MTFPISIGRKTGWMADYFTAGNELCLDWS